MIPHTFVLEPELRIFSIYNGYWYWGRPTMHELHVDLRAVLQKVRPDFDLSAPGLREAWDRGIDRCFSSIRSTRRFDLPRAARSESSEEACSVSVALPGLGSEDRRRTKKCQSLQTPVTSKCACWTTGMRSPSWASASGRYRMVQSASTQSMWALELGYRHVDTAQAYGNEESVGEALRRSGIRREEVFITTKFNPSAKDATRELGHSLERMGVDYVDLYLIHWPRGGATWAWPAMEQAHRLGFARSIGVSNFNVKELQEVMTGAVVPPVVDQVQLSPFHYRRALLHEGQERGLVFEAYSPLGTGRHLDEESVQRIAARIDRTAAQVLLRWCLQHHLVVLPKSVHRERIEENSHVFDFTLTADDMAELDGLDRTGGTDRARAQMVVTPTESSMWCSGGCESLRDWRWRSRPGVVLSCVALQRRL